MLLGSGHPPDSFSIKPSLLGTGSLGLIVFFPTFTWDVSSSPCYCTFVFTVKTEQAPVPNTPNVGTGRYY